LVVAWCRLIPSSSSPLSSTAAATPPTTASPPPRLVLPPPAIPPPRRRCVFSALSIAHGAFMDRHAAWTSSRPNASSAAPSRASLVGGRAHCASAAVTAAAMPRSPLRRSAVDPPSGRATATVARRR
jgi:hypothetical protein